MKRTKRSGFSMMEMAITSGITAVVVGTGASVTLVCAKLARSSVAISGNGNDAQTNLQVITSDIAKSDAVLNMYKFTGSAVSGGSKTAKSSASEIVLRIPAVDTAGRPLPGSYRVVDYYVKAGSNGKLNLYRVSCEVKAGAVVNGSTLTEKFNASQKLSFAYLGKSASAGGPIKATTAVVKDLSGGLFDGAITVDPSVAVVPNVSGAIYVNVGVDACERDDGRSLSTGVRLRNSVL